MGFTGSLDALHHWAEQLIEMPRALSRAAKKVAAEIPAVLEAEFSGGTDPYGSPWTPLAPATLAKGRSAPPLTDTSKMRASARANAVAASGVAVIIPAPAGYHQSGTGDMPARPIVPTSEELPGNWEALVRAAIEAEMKAGGLT